MIRAARNAATEAEFDASNRAVAEALHPSLFAELDWMEHVIADEQLEGARRLVDGLFLQHLPLVLKARLVEFQLGEVLDSDVRQHRRFYQYISGRPDALESLGKERSLRIRALLQEPAREASELLAPVREQESAALEAVFGNVEDRSWLALLLDNEIQNALARELDHVSSRMDAKLFLRTLGRRFPSAGLSQIESRADLEQARRGLHALAERATEGTLYRLAAVCDTMANLLASIDLGSMDRFGGELGGGYGHCGTCSMMYASTALLSLDPTCPDLFNLANGRLFLPTDFNVSTCVFCAEEARAEAPCLFYSKSRGTVLYNLPDLGQMSQQEALAFYRPALEQLRQRYMQRVGEAERRAFEHAAEEFTHNAADFLLAVQMGTTAREEHAWLLVRHANGSGTIVDPTKGVVIGLTRREVSQQPMAVELAARDAAKGEDSLRAAITAFAEKDIAGSRAMLERLHARFPEDAMVRRSLAVALFTLGERERARRLVEEGR